LYFKNTYKLVYFGDVKIYKRIEGTKYKKDLNNLSKQFRGLT